jgi:hypothetical protein
VRDYELLYRAPGKGDWTSLGRFAGNYQRLRRHEFAPFQAVALQLRVTTTQGEPIARVYEIRCYA